MTDYDKLLTLIRCFAGFRKRMNEIDHHSVYFSCSVSCVLEGGRIESYARELLCLQSRPAQAR